MRTPKIYLETTVFNFPFVDDAADLMTGIINKREGYKEIEIYSPTEVVENVE